MLLRSLALGTLVVLPLLMSSLANAAPTEQAKTAHEAGLRLLESKRFDEAKRELLRAVQISADYAEAWLALGNAHLATGTFVDAATAFERSLTLSPDQALARYNLAYALRKSGAHAKAAEAYRSYLQLAPDDADAYYGLGEALREAGDPRGAAEAYDRYAELERRPGREKWTAKARDMAAELRTKNPAPASTEERPHLSFARKQMKTWEGASQKPSATPAASKRPESFYVGLTSLKEARYADAIVDLKSAHEAVPDDAFVLAALAGAHLGLNQAEEAEALYRRALSLGAAALEPSLHYGLAESLRHQGKDEEAARELEIVVKSEQVGLLELAKERLAALR